MIPKIINITWMQGWDKFPSKYESNIQSIVEKNPDYKIMKWDERNIRDIVRYLGEDYLRKYDSFTTLHQKIDYGRYILLYTFGGISVDVDVKAYKSFDETPHINTSNFLVSYNSSNAFENYIKHGKAVSLNNATILVSKNNEILKGLIDHILALSCDINQSKESCIQETTGPREFTKYLNQYKDQITILDNIYFEPCPGSDENCEINSELTILDHQHEGSWLSDGTKVMSSVYYKIKQHKIKILIAMAIIVILILIFKKQS